MQAPHFRTPRGLLHSSRKEGPRLQQGPAPAPVKVTLTVWVEIPSVIAMSTIVPDGPGEGVPPSRWMENTLPWFDGYMKTPLLTVLLL